MPHRDDTQLVEDLGRGDRSALKALYHRHSAFVFRVAYRFFLSTDDASDITQSVFLSLLETTPRFRPESRLTTWLHRIVVNRCLNHRSKTKREVPGVDLEAVQANGLWASKSDAPDELVQRQQARMAVEAGLRRLSHRQRMAVILRLYEEMSYEEMAQALDCSIKSVESLLYRAKQELGSFLGKKVRGFC